MHADGPAAVQDIKEQHEPPEPQCAAEATEFSETNQVAVRPHPSALCAARFDAPSCIVPLPV